MTLAPTETYFKAVRPDGTDFHTGTVRWLPPVGEPLPDGGLVVTHPTTRQNDIWRGASAYLSVSTVPTDCTGFEWPCRLARVERTRGVGVWTPNPYSLANKRASWQWRVVEELDPKLALGPNADAVLTVIEQAKQMPVSTHDDTWHATNDACDVEPIEEQCLAALVARRAAVAASRVAAMNAAMSAAWCAVAWRTAQLDAPVAAQEAAMACVVRDLITPDTFTFLTEPWNDLVQRCLNDAKSEPLPS